MKHTIFLHKHTYTVFKKCSNSQISLNIKNKSFLNLLITLIKYCT